MVVGLLQSVQDVDCGMFDVSESTISAVDLQPFQELLDYDRGLSLEGIAVLVEPLDSDDPSQVVSICSHSLLCQLALDELLEDSRLHILAPIDLSYSSNKYSGSLLDHSDLRELHLVESITDHLEVNLLGEVRTEILLHNHRVLLLP